MKSIVLRCRELLEQGRLKAYESHKSGTPAMQVSTLLADVYDDVVLAFGIRRLKNTPMINIRVACHW